MTRIASISLAAIAAITLLAGQVSAHETKASIDARLQQELGKIEQGRQDGSITWREGLTLRAEARAIAKREAGLLEDHGKLTKRDKSELKKAEHDFAEDIEAKKNNGWRRPAWLPRIGQ